MSTTSKTSSKTIIPQDLRSTSWLESLFNWESQNPNVDQHTSWKTPGSRILLEMMRAASLTFSQWNECVRIEQTESQSNAVDYLLQVVEQKASK
jgi:hypothetical protein